MLAGGPLHSGFAQDRGAPWFGPAVRADTVEAEPSDFGRVWSLAAPPLAHLRDNYGLPADADGLRHLRRNTVRLPGCSGALASPRGLVLTAARCLDPADEAFLARAPADERSLSGLHVDRLEEVADVTDRVRAELPSGDEADTTGARRAAVARVERALRGEAPDRIVDVVPEAGGARYVAYTMRRYDDVRLVFRPASAVTGAGASDGRGTYPQHTWDVAALRIYEDGAPLRTPDAFEVRAEGARPGDAVLAAGYPAETRRVSSAEQLQFERDVGLPARRTALRTWTRHVQAYVDTAAGATAWAGRLADARAEQAALRARHEALRAPYVQKRLRDRDEALRRVDAEGRGLLDSLAALQAEKRALSASVRTLVGLQRPQWQSATLARALLVAQAREADRPVPTDALAAVPEQPPAIDAALLSAFLETGADRSASALLEGLGSAAEVVRRSALSAPAPAAGALPDDDPALTLAARLTEAAQPALDAWTRLRAREARLTARLARVRHEADGRGVTLPRGRTLRLADGRVQGYPYNGTQAPPFTTFFGLYGRAAPPPAGTGTLPDRWRTAAGRLDRSGPLTTVSSTDLAGDYGGPLLNGSLQLVGLQVADNVQAAAGTYLFLPRRMRTVSIDVRAVLQGLADVYEAEALVQELTRDAASDQ